MIRLVARKSGRVVRPPQARDCGIGNNQNSDSTQVPSALGTVGALARFHVGLIGNPLWVISLHP
jgi:hypothetical protein